MKDENSEEGKAAVQVDLRTRTKRFALRIIRLYGALPPSTVAQVLGKQLLRCGTSVGAHYRESVRARSDAEFISKLEGGLQELEETGYWLELLVESEVVPATRLEQLQDEVNQLTAILVTCVKHTKQH
jgi:four helix bundle protein